MLLLLQLYFVEIKEACVKERLTLLSGEGYSFFSFFFFFKTFVLCVHLWLPA